MREPSSKNKRKHPEAKGLLILSASLLLLLSLLSFKDGAASQNWLGLIGYITAFCLNYLLGFSSYLLTFYLGWIGWQFLTNPDAPPLALRTIYFSICITSICILLNVFSEFNFLPKFLAINVYSESLSLSIPYQHTFVRHNFGGVPLYYIYKDLPFLNLHKLLGNTGTIITFTISGIISFFLFSELRMLPVFIFLKGLPAKFGERLKEIQEEAKAAVKDTEYKEHESELELSLSTPAKNRSTPIKNKPVINTFQDGEIDLPKPEKKPVLSKREQAIAAQKVYNGDFQNYQLPPISLLSDPKKVDTPLLKKELQRQAEILEATLVNFGIEAKVGEINCGPTIASFEVHPAIGVKVQRIKVLEDDIALNLQAKSLRILAPIPGKAAVGVEIPSPYPQEVSFKEMLSQYQKQPRKLTIPVLLGKMVNGGDVTSDLSKMPHCIIAGATGSGKSVCINTLVMSILMNARPDEIKLMMVDPKRVELTSYSKLPHMIAPVITEPHGAYAAIQWLVKEMQARYEILKQLGMRNIAAFNHRKINEELENSLGIEIPKQMPFIVAIIDEFADLIISANADLETPIARIAQMARAVGIHLVLATQRPSREVITGLIKANFPTRIAFKVASRVNSQIILDENGAESLMGNGDMLFLPPSGSYLIRAQGAYISDEEINKVISYIEEQAPPNYLIPSFDDLEHDKMAELCNEGSTKDDLLQEAISIIMQTQNASTTFLQRKLKIGYARAASIMDELETQGIIGPADGSKPRKILQYRSSFETKT